MEANQVTGRIPERSPMTRGNPSVIGALTDASRITDCYLQVHNLYSIGNPFGDHRMTEGDRITNAPRGRDKVRINARPQKLSGDALQLEAGPTKRKAGRALHG